QLGERLELRQRRVDRTSDDEVRQHRGRRLTDRATLPFVGHIGDGVTVEANPQGHLIPTGGVHLEGLSIVWLPQPTGVRILVVVQDDLLVHGFQIHQETPPTPKNRCASRTPFTRTSTSDSSL